MSKNEANFLFLARLISHKGKECVLWPFGKDGQGYGQVYFRKKLRRAHRVMCELVNGPPPTTKHGCAHSCARGHDGCVNPRHLSWKTHEENMQDIRAHGTGRKKGTPRRKLTDQQVLEIRASDKTNRELAPIYGVNHRTIGQIRSEYYRPNRPLRHRGHPYTESQRSIMAVRAKELRAQGASYHKIGEEIGCSKLIAKTLCG